MKALLVGVPMVLAVAALVVLALVFIPTVTVVVLGGLLVLFITIEFGWLVGDLTINAYHKRRYGHYSFLCKTYPKHKS